MFGELQAAHAFGCPVLWNTMAYLVPCGLNTESLFDDFHQTRYLQIDEPTYSLHQSCLSLVDCEIPKGHLKVRVVLSLGCFCV